MLDALDLIAATPPFQPEQQPLSPGSLHVIYQVYDRAIASEVKYSALLEMYPPEAQVYVISAAGVPRAQSVVLRGLAELDRAGATFHHLTTVLIPPLASPELFNGFYGLTSIMARLRNPDGGCPWDREQTPETLRRFLIEEAHEVLDAMDTGRPG